ncbi:Dnaj heat shock n-terminal domain-containing protein [Thalictrum thalictroides]|uniref:Dnaj heat shock n-terminal domain-containing protein n=1 Tax=Thalictrum thalictroides TaxID=46969 RepID=A0A7J6VAN4_THATH|nr:Dnaj heat shock n-terminal domain-containing protein [Thalictrum thalictroides]
MEINHYEVLGFQLESIGVEGLTKLNSNEISKAYKSKALELHPDKRPNDPNAKSDFQQLKTSYDILMDVKLRKDFDAYLRSKYEEERRWQQWQQRRKMMHDPGEKEKEMDHQEKEMDMADFEAFKKGLERKMMADVEKKKDWLRHKFEEEKKRVLRRTHKFDEGEERRCKNMRAAHDLVIQEEKERKLRKMMNDIKKDEEKRRR